MTKVKKNYLLLPETTERIAQLSVELQLPFGAVIDKVIALHFETRTEEHKALMEALNVKVEQQLHPLHEELKRIRIIGNVVDRNTQMMLEFWNHYFVVTDAKALGSTDKFVTKQLIEAEKLVQARMTSQH